MEAPLKFNALKSICVVKRKTRRQIDDSYNDNQRNMWQGEQMVKFSAQPTTKHSCLFYETDKS